MEPRRKAQKEDEEGEPLDSLVKPLDRRRLREIRQWLEGNRPDGPDPAELREYVEWVSLEIERALARHQPARDLLVLLNAARGQLHERGGAGDG